MATMRIVNLSKLNALSTVVGARVVEATKLGGTGNPVVAWDSRGQAYEVRGKTATRLSARDRKS